MASQVVTNFEKHLAQLAIGASRESIQTLSKYMAFNRKKHGATLCEALSNAIRTKATTPGRKMLYLSVMHEVLISESPLQAGYQNDKKWDRLADLRSQLGETVVVDAIASVRDCAGTSEADLAKIRNWIEQWEEIEAFGGPTIVLSARRALTAEKTVQVEPAVEEKAEASSPSDGAAVKETATSESTPPAEKETPSAATDGDVAKVATESIDTGVASPSSKGKSQEDAVTASSPPVDMPPAFDFEAEVRHELTMFTYVVYPLYYIILYYVSSIAGASSNSHSFHNRRPLTEHSVRKGGASSAPRVVSLSGHDPN